MGHKGVVGSSKGLANLGLDEGFVDEDARKDAFDIIVLAKLYFRKNAVVSLLSNSFKG